MKSSGPGRAKRTGVGRSRDRDAARGDRDQDDPDDPHRRPAQEALPVPPPDRGIGQDAPTAEADPGLAAGPLGGELAAQEDHRAEVLDRGGEAHLGDQLGAAPGRLEREPPMRAGRAGERQREASTDRRRPGARRRAGAAASPGRRASSPASCSRRAAGRGPTRRPGPGRSRRRPRPQPAPGGEQRRAEHGDRDQRAEGAREPIHSTAIPGSGGRRSCRRRRRRPRRRARAIRSWRSAAGRSAVPRDRRQQRVPDLGGLDRQRPTPRPRPQSGEHGQRDRDAEQCRRVVGMSSTRRGRPGLVDAPARKASAKAPKNTAR